MWIIGAEKYHVNHLFVSWSGTRANAFVHLWWIIDRLGSTIDGASSYWPLGLRGLRGFTESTDIPGATDAYFYPKEIMAPPHIEIMSKSMDRCRKTEISKVLSSFCDFRKSIMISKLKLVMDMGEWRRVIPA